MAPHFTPTKARALTRPPIIYVLTLLLFDLLPAILSLSLSSHRSGLLAIPGMPAVLPAQSFGTAVPSA